MRASRLLQLLLLLQNRGRLTCATLASALEVTRRTILRDVDALTEAGLPIVVTRGNQGGVELGFNYRTRLTGLSAGEAEALAVLLAQPAPVLDQLGIRLAATRAVAKLRESFPDGVRERLEEANRRFRFQTPHAGESDHRLTALALAVREGRVVRIRTNGPDKQIVHPESLLLGPDGWAIIDELGPDRPIPTNEWGDINISARRFVLRRGPK